MLNIGLVRYIKKEDAAYFIKQQYKMAGVILISQAFVLGLIYFFVVPKITQLYSDFSITLHPLTNFLPYIFITMITVFVLFGLTSFGKKVDESELKKKLRAYKPREMILTHKILEMRMTYMSIVLSFVAIAILIISIITPIYSLTNSLQKLVKDILEVTE